MLHGIVIFCFLFGLMVFVHDVFLSVLLLGCGKKNTIATWMFADDPAVVCISTASVLVLVDGNTCACSMVVVVQHMMQLSQYQHR
jgi:hypothetical protein